jgi:uncharacterized membrane protein
MRILVLFFASLLVATAAEADVVYSVMNVRPGDTLNMRLQPRPNAPVVQTIPHNGTGIALTGRSSSGGWFEVTYRRKRGWVNARFLGIGQGRFALPAYLDCFGTEPFWSIAVTPGLARADLMFTERRNVYRLTGAHNAMGRTDIFAIRGAANRGSQMSLIVRHEACSDGMSDARYPYSTVALISGLNTIAGCCRPAAPR